MKIKHILVSQPKPADVEKSPYGELVTKHGVELDFQKLIKVEEVSPKEFRSFKIRILDHTAVIFTSRKAADHFFSLCKKLRLEVPDNMKYFCTSESTAYYLQNYVQYRKRKIFYSNQSDSELLEIIKKHSGERVIIPSSEGSKSNIMKLLDIAGVLYTQAVMYRTIPCDVQHVDISKYGVLAIFSPIGIDSLLHNFPAFNQGNTVLAAFGQATQTAAVNANLRLDIAVPSPNAPSMTMALDQFLESQNKEE